MPLSLRVLLLLTFAVPLLASCGSESTPPGSGGATKGSGPAAPSGKAPLGDPRLAELSTTEVPGFRTTIVSKGPGALLMKYDGTAPTAKGAYPSAFVTLEPCRSCDAMDVATWRGIEWPKAGIPKPVRRDPGLVYDVHAVALPGGRTGIGIYKEGIDPSPADPDAFTPTVHAFLLIFNDGRNQIQIDVSSMGALPRTREELREAMSRESLAAAAQAIFAAFAGEF